MRSIVQSISFRSSGARSPLISALFAASVVAVPRAALAQSTPPLAPTMPSAPTAPGATPGFTGQAPNPYDPTSPYYAPPPQPRVIYVQAPPPPIAAGVVPEADHPEAATPKRTGVELGFRTGVAFPGSQVMSGLDLGSFVSSAVPIWLSLGYRFTENAYVGIYGQYAFISVNGCDGGGCSAHDVRGGIDFQYHFEPRESFDPWIGYGAGYEELGLSAGGANVHFDGFELANLQLGFDLRVARALAMGPFASFSVGQYGSAGSGGASASIDQTAMHEWFTIGLRAQLM